MAGRVHALLVIAAMMVEGCIFDSSGIHARRRDLVAPSVDQIVSDQPLDTTTELPDGPKPDARPDRTTLDLPKIDAKKKGDLKKGDLKKGDLPKLDQAKKTCAQLYGAATSYSSCAENEKSCTFFAATYGTCDALCATYGGTCTAATDTNLNNMCGSSGSVGCDKTHNDQKCTCTRP
jgi:hypothetical protein